MRLNDKSYKFGQKKLPKPLNMGPMLFLSLFLLLLAFFILLNALSQIEEDNFKKVLNSFTSDFAQAKDANETDSVMISNFGPAPTPAESLQNAKQMWVSAVPIARVESFSKGERMMIELPYREVFVEDTAMVREDRTRILEAMAVAMNQQFEGLEIAVIITLFVDDFIEKKNTEDGKSVLDTVALSLDLQANAARRDDLNQIRPAGSAPIQSGAELGIYRAVNMGQTLIKAGIPDRNVKIGIRQTEKSIGHVIRLRFYVREVGIEANTLDNMVEPADPIDNANQMG